MSTESLVTKKVSTLSDSEIPDPDVPRTEGWGGKSTPLTSLHPEPTNGCRTGRQWRSKGQVGEKFVSDSGYESLSSLDIHQHETNGHPRGVREMSRPDRY